MAELSRGPQARRSFLRLAGAALLMTVAGCVPRGEPQRPLPPTGERPVPVQPVEEARHQVAVLVPLSGPNAGVGRSLLNAANLALLDTGSRDVRITAFDTANGAAAAANLAISGGSRLILGPLLAEEVQAAAPIARRAGVPVIAFSNDVSVAGDGVYIMGLEPGQAIDRVVAHARSQGVQRFAGLAPEGLYGRRAGQALIEAVEDAGGRMVALQTYPRRAGALTAAIGRLNSQSGYDAVLIADTADLARQAAPIIRRGPSGQAKILGTELWNTESNLGAQAALRGAWFAAPSDARFNQLRARYRARYDASPYRLASLGYDAVLLAVRMANGGWRVGRPFPASELRQSDGFTGVDGAFRFGRDNVVDRALEVKQVTVSGVTTVSPAPANFR